MKNPKEKGNREERLVCRQLTKWVTGDDSDPIFWRSINSGAAFTNFSRRGAKAFEDQAGDLQAIKPEGAWLVNNFSVEVKSSKDLEVENLIFNGAPGKLHTFWNKHQELCAKVRKRPLLVAKQNHRGQLLLMPSNLLRLITYVSGHEFGQVIIPSKNLAIADFQRFLEVVPYDYFHKTVSACLPTSTVA